MKKIVLSIVFIVFSILRIEATDYFAATNGLPGNTGSIISPWDLRTALAKTSVFVGGDKLELRGGSYTNAPEHYVPGGNEGDIFQALISGSYGNEIIIESYTNEWAMLDGLAFGPPYEYHATSRPTLMLGSSNPANASQGRFLHLRNFEIMSTSTNLRYSATVDCPGCVPPTNPAFPTDFYLSDGLYVFGVSNIIENLVIHDLTTGISPWEQSSHTIVQNCIIWNNGWTGVTQLHGHGMYTQNKTPRENKDISYNIVINNWDNSIQAYGSGSAEVYHYRLHNNILVNNRLLVGGRVNAVQGDNQIRDNLQYNSDLVFTYFTSTNSADIQVANNYIGLGGLQGGSWTNNLMTNNFVINPPTTKLFDLVPISGVTIPTGWIVDRNHYFYTPTNATGFRVEGAAPMNMSSWTTNTGFDLNSTIALNPITNFALLQPNQYSTNLAYLAVYNWATNSTFSTNLSVLGWSSSDTIRVRNAQNYLVDITTNTLPSTTLTLSMLASDHTVALPHGSTTNSGPITFPKFGAFVLERMVNAPPPVTNILTVTSSPTSVSVSATSDLNGNGTGTTTFTRNYLFGTAITLIANSSVLNKSFQKWQKGGVDYSTVSNITFASDASFTMSAIYTNNATNTITITSTPFSVIVTNSPADQGGITQTVTPGSIKYFFNTSITLTAPSNSMVTNLFQKWTKNGVDFAGTPGITFSTSTNDTYNAVYVAPPSGSTVTNNFLLISRRRPF